MIIKYLIRYKCPTCKYNVCFFDAMSGNTFGAEYYSDLFSIVPMMIDNKPLTKCDNCHNFFWIKKAEKRVIALENYTLKQKIFNFFNPYIKLSSGKKDIGSVDMTLEDYIQVLNQKIYTSDVQELYIRNNIWWKFNHRIRHRSTYAILGQTTRPLLESLFEENLWNENLLRMMQLLQKNILKHKELLKNNEGTEYIDLNTNETTAYFVKDLEAEIFNNKLMLVEINRNLGNFQKAIEILDDIDFSDSKINIKNALKLECKQENKEVIRLYRG